MRLGAVVIGRNEGARLIAALDALKGQVAELVYVDSGSTDGSVEAAQARGAQVVLLDAEAPFTAARARNAGLAALSEDIELVQFVDGDCEVREGWLEAAATFLQKTPRAAVVCGRRRERRPEASLFNAQIDREWDTPVGEAKFCGGDAMMRMEALRDVGGFRSDLIAGEEPELCVRLRQAGWEVHRIDAEMTWHEADITRLSQWWRRARRAGHAFAEGAALHGTLPERHWVAERNRALLWGAVLPLLILVESLFLSSWFLLIGLIYPAQVLRLTPKHGLGWAFLTTLSRFPEALGALGYMLSRKPAKIIEYK